MRHDMVHNLNHFAHGLFGSLVDERGNLNRDVVSQLFHHFDKDNSGTIETSELEALMTGSSLNSLYRTYHLYHPGVV